jgi:hypothetical protein
MLTRRMSIHKAGRLMAGRGLVTQRCHQPEFVESGGSAVPMPAVLPQRRRAHATSRRLRTVCLGAHRVFASFTLVSGVTD